MGSLAGLLKELGHDVAGSDTAFHPPMGPALKSWGIRLHEGFDAKHLEGQAHGGEQPEVVIIGNVCRRDNPEALAADQLGIKRLHIAEALCRFALAGTSPLVVAGTHGKTTTSSLTAHLLSATGFNPGFLIGGVPRSLGRSFQKAGKRRLGNGSSPAAPRGVPFVIEGDEYDTAYWEKTAKFLHYQAEVAVLTSIEHDHIDIYPTFEDYLDAFRRFVLSLPENGLLVAYAGDAQIVELAKLARCEVAYYALGGEDTHGVAPHWLGEVAEERADGTTFDLFAGGVLAGRFVSPLCGAHNLRNVVAALGVCAQGYGARLVDLAPALANFEGVKRRQELRGTPNMIRVYDDFAHHPTAVRETLIGLRKRHPEQKMIAIFEPRSATACRKIHQLSYESSFDSATDVILAPVGRPELSKDEILDVPLLAANLNARNSGKTRLNAYSLPDVETIVKRVVDLAEPGDTVVVLSNGAFGGIHEKLLAALSAQAPSFSSGEIPK